MRILNGYVRLGHDSFDKFVGKHDGFSREFDLAHGTRRMTTNPSLLDEMHVQEAR